MQRAAFADVCFSIVKRFSSRFIKDWFFDLILDLLYDPVPNIRLQVRKQGVGALSLLAIFMPGTTS